MNESKIHQLIRTELQTQYEQAKQDWLSDMPFTYFDFDWEPDWDYIRGEVEYKLFQGKVSNFLYEEYGADYEDVMIGHVFQVWETMIEDFKNDLENTKKDLVYDKKNRESESKCVYAR